MQDQDTVNTAWGILGIFSTCMFFVLTLGKEYAPFLSFLLFIYVPTSQMQCRWWEGGTLLQQTRGEWFNCFSSLVAPHSLIQLQSWHAEWRNSNTFSLSMQDSIIVVAPPVVTRAYQELSRGIVNLQNASIAMLCLHWALVPVLCSMLLGRVLAACVSFVVICFLWAQNFIALQLESPFGCEPNDLPMQQMQGDWKLGTRVYALCAGLTSVTNGVLFILAVVTGLMKGSEAMDVDMLRENEKHQGKQDASFERELSKFLAHWSEKDEKPIQDDDKILRPKVEVLPPPLPSLSSPPAQLVAPPTPATLNSMNEAEQDIARMRMKARTYTSTEGICGPLAEGSVTLFGTPKNAATARPPKGGVTAQRTSSLDSGNQEKSDESKQDPGPPKTLGVVPREAHGPGEEKTEKRRGSNRVSKSVSMREPRSIFLHQITNRAGEEDEEDEDMDDPDEAIPCKKESLCTCIQKMCLWLVCLEYFDYVMGSILKAKDS
ncbi:scn4aa [Symbiodinium necroappetens]|uniref:Scn4aa protein n=1 Tax=Symbiodinium necroappetens TaxID=1628268 RepID=A0A812LQG9_9DINO|nr:scn4aa [Symbiodinium necroappetens]